MEILKTVVTLVFHKFALANKTTDMKTNRDNTVSTKEPKKTSAHFSTSEIKKFTEDPTEQQMIGNYGMICPTCSVEMLHKYCPDCGRKTIIPNFCNNCKIECKTQFCDKCGTAIFNEGMDSKNFLFIAGNTTERQINKLITLSMVSGDNQNQIFSLVELVIQVLMDIKQEIVVLTETVSKSSKKLNAIDERISCLDTDVDNSFKKLEENLAEKQTISYTILNHVHSSFKEIIKKIDEVDSIVSSVSSDIESIEKEGVYFKPRND